MKEIRKKQTKDFFNGPIPASFWIYSMLSFLQRQLQQTVDNHWAFPHRVDWACLCFRDLLINGREAWVGLHYCGFTIYKAGVD